MMMHGGNDNKQVKSHPGLQNRMAFFVEEDYKDEPSTEKKAIFYSGFTGKSE